MRKLNAPEVTFEDSFTQCVSGIGAEAERLRYNDNLPDRQSVEEEYITLAYAGDLYTLPRFPAGGLPDHLVSGALSKSDFKKLYSQYLVPKEKPGRAIYQQLKVTANGKCPLCGDIGHVATLDHYLPKANFPLYSVLPRNLVPCCRDCNSEKLNAFATNKEDQVLHPYFDGDHFFNTQWIKADVVEGDPPVIEFIVDPPAFWSDVDKQRVKAHFREYGLAEKFGREAAADLPEVIHMRRTVLEGLAPAEFAHYLRERSMNLMSPVNNWRRITFASLAESNWFCTETFI